MSEENPESNDTSYKISVCKEPFHIRSITQIETEPSTSTSSSSDTSSSQNQHKKRNLTEDLDDNNNLDDSKRPRAENLNETEDSDIDLTEVRINEKAKSPPRKDPSQKDYWKAIYESELFSRRSLKIQNLLNRDFGMKNKYYGYETPKSYINETINSLDLMRRMKLSHKLSYHEGCVNSLNFNRIGTLLCSGSDDHEVCVWDWARNNLVLAFDSGHKTNVFQTKFMPFTGDSQIITSARDGQVRLALISSSGSYISSKKLAKHAGECHKISIEYDSCNLFLTCGEDGVVYEVDLRQSTPAKILTCKDDSSKIPLYTISSNPIDTYQFIIAGKDQHVRLYDKRMLAQHDTKCVQMYTPENLKNSQNSQITSAVFNNDGTEILSSYSDDDIYLFDINQSNYKYRYKGHRNSRTIKGVNFYGPNSDYVISGSDCGRVFFWEKTTQQIVNVQKGDEEIVNALEPHPNFPILATSGIENDVKIWCPISEQPCDLTMLNEIVSENQRRQFSLSSFEFELLLLLMHGSGNRMVVRRGRENATDSLFTSRLDSSDLSSEDNRGFGRLENFLRRSNFEDDDDDDDDEEEENDDESDDDSDDDDDDDDMGADFEDIFDHFDDNVESETTENEDLDTESDSDNNESTTEQSESGFQSPK
ncbi:unnamed protein product [Brachionus calyciflorus]|uniref:DDB1-and CUL4-associated factor 8 n=1 Tax=Brachionus calyciflorus TaxID=104777 RepID=A0A813R119_9BILA|nr:unnamed protein product [Brachionus calyciflorus]